MSDSRPGFSKASPQDTAFNGSASIDDQVGFYSQTHQPHLGDINARVGQTPAAADDRFANALGSLDDARK